MSTAGVTEGPVGVGTRATDKRRVLGGMKVNATYEIVEYDSPRRVSFQVVNGPVRPCGTVTVEPLDGGARSRATLELDLKGRGIGMLFAPMARRQAAREVPGDQLRLKQRLQAGSEAQADSQPCRDSSGERGSYSRRPERCAVTEAAHTETRGETPQVTGAVRRVQGCCCSDATCRLGERASE